MLARFIDWRPVLTIVQPDTLVRWHRQTFRAAVALEISSRWAAADTHGRPAVDRRDGAREPNMG